MLEAPFQISKARLLLVESRLIWTWPVACPELSSTILGKLPDVLSGLYHAQMEKADPIVINGMVRNCLLAFVLTSPPVCARYATFCRSVMLPGTDATEPVLVRGPVIPLASSRNAFGWNG
jgi:hypothetical protein